MLADLSYSSRRWFLQKYKRDEETDVSGLRRIILIDNVFKGLRVVFNVDGHVNLIEANIF